MTSLPEALVRYRAELESAIAREQAVRRRQRKRRRRLGVVAAAIVVVSAASALAAAREFFSDDPFTARGEISRTVDGIGFSFIVPPHRQPYYKPDFVWEHGPIEKVGDELRIRGFSISTSIVPGQAAEAVVFWTTFPGGGEATACPTVLGSVGRSAVDLAAAMARAPGVTLTRRPTKTTVGGRPAIHLVLGIRSDRGCHPGYFFRWRSQHWGAFAPPGASVGDTIRIWIVGVEGKRLVIQAQTGYHGSLGSSAEIVRAYKAEFETIDQDITKMIASIRFA